MSETVPPAGISGQPDEYLAEGWRGADGALRKPLTGLAAFGVALRLQRGEVPPDWPGAVLEALRQFLPETEGPVEERLALGLEEALNLVESMVDQASPDELDDWLAECAAHVQSDADLQSFLEHFQAVVRQYAALIAASTGDPGEPEEAEPA